MTTTTKPIYVAHYCDNQEKEQVRCESPEEARRVIEEGNRTAAPRWRWGLSSTNFLRDDGTDMPINEANALRRACGVAEY